jgi:hypothetical protein
MPILFPVLKKLGRYGGTDTVSPSDAAHSIATSAADEGDCDATANTAIELFAAQVLAWASDSTASNYAIRDEMERTIKALRGINPDASDNPPIDVPDPVERTIPANDDLRQEDVA